MDAKLRGKLALRLTDPSAKSQDQTGKVVDGLAVLGHASLTLR